jgi:uncharacterized protein GlcG (DUF336 family)
MNLSRDPDMSHDLAQRLVAEVHAEAARQGVRLAAAVVDRGGNLVAAARMDGAQLGALSLGLDKAFTAVSFGHPTSAWATSSAPGGPDWGLGSTLGGRTVVFPGGVPLYADGHLVGGLGVSGAASVVDEKCAEQAAGVCDLRTRA